MCSFYEANNILRHISVVAKVQQSVNSEADLTKVRTVHRFAYSRYKCWQNGRERAFEYFGSKRTGNSYKVMYTSLLMENLPNPDILFKAICDVPKA